MKMQITILIICIDLNEDFTGLYGYIVTSCSCCIIHPIHVIVKDFPDIDSYYTNSNISQLWNRMMNGYNNLYIASPVGLIKYDGTAFTSIPAFASLDLFDVELDTLGRVWIMGRDGIYVYEQQTGSSDGIQYTDLGINIDFGYLDKEVIQTQGFEYDPFRRCFWLGGETGLLKLEISTDSIMNLDNILIYPNPAVNYNRIHIKNTPSDARINIYSITGRQLAEDLVPDNGFGEVIWTIPDNIGSGLYFAVIKSQYGRKVCKFAIIK